MGDIDRQLLVFGRLKLPKGTAATWLAQRVHEADFSDWPELLEGGHLEACTVREVVDAITKMQADQGEVTVRVKGDAVSVHGFLLEPGTLAWSRDVATPLRAGAALCGKGELTFLRVTGEGGVRFVLDPKQSKVEELAPDDAMDLLGSRKAGDALGRYEFTMNPPPPPPPPPPEYEALREPLAAALEGVPGVEVDLSHVSGVESAFNQLVLTRPEAAVPFALTILRARIDTIAATYAGFVLRGSEDPAVAEAMLDFAAPADRASAPILVADVSDVIRKPRLYENLASLRAPGLVDLVKARFDALLERTDSDAGLARLTGALLTLGALDAVRATQIADRLPTQFGALRPAPKK